MSIVALFTDGAAFRVLISVIGDLLYWLRLSFRSTQSIEAENLFLRRQLALYVERGTKPRRVCNPLVFQDHPEVEG